MDLYLSTLDAIHDVNLSKTKFRELHHQWEGSRNLLEDRNINCDYKRVLSFVLEKSEQIYGRQGKRKRENVDEEDDYGVKICRISDGLHILDKGKKVIRGDYEAKKKKVAFRVHHEHLYQQRDLAKKSSREVDRVDNMKGLHYDMVLDHDYLDDLLEDVDLENDIGSDPEYLDHLYENVDLENGGYVYMDKGESSRKISGGMKQKVGLNGKHELESSPVKKTNGPTRGKSRNETNKLDNIKDLPNDMDPNIVSHHLHRIVKLENDQHVYTRKGRTSKISGVDDKKQGHKKVSEKEEVGVSNQMICVENQHKKHDTLLTSVNKITNNSTNKINNLSLEQSRNDESEEVKIEKCSSSEFSAYKNMDENNLQEKGEDASDSDVEILNSVAINEEGLIGPFVPSKKLHKSLREDRESSAFEEYRKQVMDVLRKPFNKEEYAKHQESVKDYLDYHPDLRRTLTKYRYKKGKRLNILRGFFFWLQNLTREGSFKPWKNRECLAVEPGSS